MEQRHQSQIEPNLFQLILNLNRSQKNPEPPLINVEFYDAIDAAKAVHEVLVTVEPQGSQEVPEPPTATKPLVVVTVELQGPEEVPEPLGILKVVLTNLDLLTQQDL